MIIFTQSNGWSIGKETFGSPVSDLKLENVVLTKDHTAKLVDFGSAVELNGAEQFLNVGDVRGTLMYLAPECWNGIYSPASDIWALGVLLCFMLFMTVPFNAATKEEQKAKVTAVVNQNDLSVLKKLYFILINVL